MVKIFTWVRPGKKLLTIYRSVKNIFLGERKNAKELKMAISEFYLSLIIIQDYQKFNMLGFKKINKKFDKNLHCDQGNKWFTEKVKKSDLNNSHEIDKLILRVNKTTFILHLTTDDFRWRFSSRMSWRREIGRKPWPD